MIQKTEYRIIKLITFIGDKYLQFKSKKQVRCFPDFWNTKETLCWRFIPNESFYFFGYINENDCPTSLPFMMESRYLNCFHGQEKYLIFGLTPFIAQFPNINDYFVFLNRKRDKYLEEKKALELAPDIYMLPK